MFMEKTILVGGEAGQGSGLTSYLIGKTFSCLGYYVFNYRDYPSLIRGGHNFNILRISDQPVFSHEPKYDVILALDEKTSEMHKKNLIRRGLIVRASEFEEQLKKLNGPKFLVNDILLGYLFGLFGVNLKILLKTIKEQFAKNFDLIEMAIKQGYKAAQKTEDLKRAGPARFFISGNEGIAIGALSAGLDIYLAYPMTPATSVLHFLAKKQVQNNILVFQPENEIAVVNAALGGSFAGAKVMVGTSGGGFALMTEALSLAGMADLPLVIYLSQRTGPSTGLPTYTSQADLRFALNAGQGEFAKIVVAPGDAQEAVTRTQEAFYLSLKYRTPAIILGDKHLAESNWTFEKIKKSRLFAFARPSNRVNSYEHDEQGYTREDAQTVAKMQEKRIRKWRFLEKAINKLNPVSIYGSGKNLIISHGSTKGAIIDALPELPEFRFLQISYLSPFPKEKVAKEIKKAKKVILVENSASGALADVIAQNTGFQIKDKILKYDGRPFTPDFLIEKILSGDVPL